MNAAWGYTAAGLILAGAGACAIAILSCGSLRGAADRARWAWRCRKLPSPPAIEYDPLDRDEQRAFIGAVRAWRRPAVPEPERSRA